MVPVSAFFSRLIPHVVGCPEPLAHQAVVDSAIALCDQALVVQIDLDPVSVIRGLADYELEMPSQQRLSQVINVGLEHRALTPVPSYQVGVVSDVSGQPKYYFSRDIDEILQLRLFPTPDRDYQDELRVRVATRPTRDATRLHQSLFNDWSEAVVEGALARLYDTPGQAFSSEAKAMLLYKKVRAKINDARIEALRGRVMSSMSVSMRGF